MDTVLNWLSKREQRAEDRKERIREFFAGIPSLTKFIVTSMAAIAIYTAVLFWMRVRFEIWIDTEFSKLWYAYWGSEIFLCSGLKTGKWFILRKNPFTGEGGTSSSYYSSESDSDDALG